MKTSNEILLIGFGVLFVISIVILVVVRVLDNRSDGTNRLAREEMSARVIEYDNYT